MGGGDGQPGGDSGIHLAVGDAKGLSRRRKERDPKAVGKLEASDDGGMFFMVTDPEGNKLKIMQSTN